MGRIGKYWNQFFFDPISPASLGLFRICFGFVVFLSVLGKYPFRRIFYSDQGIVSYATLTHFFPGNPWLYFRWMPDQDPGLQFFFIGLLVASAFLTVGLFSRVSSVLVFLGIICLSNRNFFVDNAGDDLLRINCFFLMFAPCGAAYSLDRVWKIKQGLVARGSLPRVSPWAQRLLQLQLAYLYIDTFLLKLPGEGWQDGTALYYALNYRELQRFNFKYFFYTLWQIKLATYSVEFLELAAGTLIWFRAFRYWVLAGAFLLHFGINLTMQFPVFQYVMMASLIVFIYPEDMERWLNYLAQRSAKIPLAP